MYKRQAEEAAAKFEQVFGVLANDVRDNLETMAEANRRSSFDLISYASTLQDTFVPLGFARDEAAKLSTTITQLGIDIAAFSNKSDPEVIQNLTSAIVGNHEAVRSYGIVITETVLKQELARLGMDDLRGAALEMAKAQARVNIIMRASADAQGAAVREADSYTNTLKAFDAAVLELKVGIGEGLLPMMTDLAEVAILIVEALNDDYVRGLLAADEANRKAGVSAEELTADLKGVIDTVSYTHLDVYKRQRQHRHGRSHVQGHAGDRLYAQHRQPQRLLRCVGQRRDGHRLHGRRRNVGKQSRDEGRDQRPGEIRRR